MSLAYSPNGKLIAVGRISGTLEIWATGSWKLHKQLDVNRPKAISALDFSPDGNRLAFGSFMGPGVDAKTGQIISSTSPDDLVILDASSLKRVRSFTSKHSGSVIRGLIFNPSGKMLISGGAAKSIAVHDTNTGDRAVFLDGFPHVAYPALSRDGKLLAVGAGQEVRIYETRKIGTGPIFFQIQ